MSTNTQTAAETGVRITLADPTEQMLREIADRSLHQRDLAQTIALVFQWNQRDEVDWAAVGAAAVARWSLSGWHRVKQLAWSGRCWQGDGA